MQSTENFSLNLNGSIIEESQYATYLGVILDNKLNFQHHIDHVNVKLKKSIALIAKLRHYVQVFTRALSPYI